MRSLGLPRMTAGAIDRIARICMLLAVSTLAAAGPMAAAAVVTASPPMGASEARHLLTRTGFSASLAEIETFAGLTRAQAVERLLLSAQTVPTRPAPAELDQWTPRSTLRTLPEQERRALLLRTIQQGQALRGWWFGEMLVTASPFTERMTLFWHNHFVSSLRKVRPTRLMYRQNLLLREHAMGNFRAMLHALSRDPAMIVYLDNASNRKGQANENFAREVMELFTLGEGNYSEDDVKEAARAFTGWGIDGETGEFRFRPALHDDGLKTILGSSGAFDGGDVLELLLAQPQTAELIVHKLWREFVSPAPDAAEVRRIAAEFRASGYEIRTALRAVLTSAAFYAEGNRASLVKSPVDLLVGTLRQFRVEVGDVYPFVVMARQLGQDLMAPPNVKGWPGGESWINAGTLLARKQAMERLFRAAEPGMQAMAVPAADAGMAGGAAIESAAATRFQKAMRELRFDQAAWSAQFEHRKDADIARVLLPAQPVHPIADSQERLALVRQLTLDPVYQLK